MNKKKLILLAEMFLVFAVSFAPARTVQNIAPGSAERKAILNELRKGIKEFDKYRIGFNYLFQEFLPPEDVAPRFIVSYLKTKDNWAWIEAEAENFSVLTLCALLGKEAGRWQLKGLVNPQRAVCRNIEGCLDVKAYVYRKFSDAFPLLPGGLLPETDPARRLVLTALSDAIRNEPSSNTVYVVRYFKTIAQWAWIEADPRSLDGTNQLEPVHALLYLDNGKWRVKTLRRVCDECKDDPECVDDQKYFRKLRREFPSVPRDLFPK